jgi:hypothetical protein
MDPGKLLTECGESFLGLAARIHKYQDALGELASDPNVTEERIKKKEVKMDAAWKRADAAEKAMRTFLASEFRKDYENAPDDKKAAMAAWKKRIEKLLFEMGQKMAVRSYILPADVLFEEK